MSQSKPVISNRPLGELLQDSLTSTPCVNVRRDAKVRVAAGMLVQYLETFTDSVLVREGARPIGVVGGREIIRGVYKDPSPDFFEMRQVEEIADRRLNVVRAETNLDMLISLWKEVGRAFAIVGTGNDGYSAVSVKKLLEMGTRSKADLRISEIPKKRVITFGGDATFGDVMKLMLENKTRKILLDGTNRFINDRIIIEEMERLEYLAHTGNFLEIPADTASLEEAAVVSGDLSISEISKMMFEMPHPLAISDDGVVSPWDVCSALGRL